MLIGNDRKRLNRDLDVDLERREVAMPRPLDLAELEAVEGGTPLGIAVGVGIAVTGFAVGAALGAVAGVAVGVAISQ